jgi:hypothetical protein
MVRWVAAGAWLVAALVALAPAPAQAGTVTAHITADNAYSFGLGNLKDGPDALADVENCTAANIFSCSGGPENYVVPVVDGCTQKAMYVVTYDDEAVTQGWLGSFLYSATPNKPVYTGDPVWEVCAVGTDRDDNCGGPVNNPTLAEVRAAVTMCNRNFNDPLNTTHSKGWVGINGQLGRLGKVAVGEMNDLVNPPQPGSFPQVCTQTQDPNFGIAEAAKWQWYNDGAVDSFNAVAAGNFPEDSEYLIFRIQACASPVRPITRCGVTKFGTGTLGVVGVGPRSFSVSGTAVLSVQKTVNPDVFNTPYLNLEATGTIQGIGPISVVLNNLVPSTGTIASRNFPALHHTDLNASIRSPSLSTEELVSDVPVQLEATIDSTSPTARYNMVNATPVGFHTRSNPTVVVTLDAFQVDTAPLPPPVPTLTWWGGLVLVLLMLGTGFVLFRRRLGTEA